MFDRASEEALAIPGAVFADLDESTGRLRFGVENANAMRGIRVALDRLGLAEGSYDVVETEPIVMAATLRDTFRPTQGGIQIHFSNYVCTLGFNADDGAERSLITNSHCTKRQGGVENTLYYQPASSTNPAAIATEAEDPGYGSMNGCPKGRKCRRADVSRARYAAGTASTRGVIAKTTGANNGSLTVAGAFTITAQNNTSTSWASGTVVNKVGRTTGWTQGAVVSSCVNTNVSGTNITLLCQTFVQDPGGASVVGGGDSGSGVFRITSGDNVELVGILWGGSSDNKLFVFSPLKQVRDEIGPIVATN